MEHRPIIVLLNQDTAYHLHQTTVDNHSSYRVDEMAQNMMSLYNRQEDPFDETHTQNNSVIP
jgi:hypothetical protein